MLDYKPPVKSIPIKTRPTVSSSSVKTTLFSPVVKTEIPLKENQENSFSELGRVLDFLGLENEYVPIDDKNKMEQLLVKLDDIDKSLEPVIVELVFLNDIFKIASEQEDKDDYIDEDEEPSEILQFFTKLPISTTEAYLSGISALILRFNPYITVGNFGLTEGNEVYFRYCLMTEIRKVNSLLATEIFGMMSFFINILGKEIKQYSTGSKTLEDALASGLQSLVNINTSGEG